MGNSSSSSSRGGHHNLTQEQQDIRYLADRMAFGDKELERLYRCYYSIQRLETSHKLSFLTDWAIHSALVAEERFHSTQQDDEVQVEWHEQKKSLMLVLEQEILPENFGNGLYRNCFVSPHDKTLLKRDYHFNSNNFSSGTLTTSASGDSNTAAAASEKEDDETLDEYTRVARLEKFFDAASNCSGRRGNRVALSELVTHISKFHPVDAINHQDLSGDQRNGVVSSDVNQESKASVLDNKNNSDQNHLLLSAQGLVQSVYRMALACSFLSAANRDEDVTQFLPNDGDEASDHHPALKALSQSIIDFAKKKRIRANPFGVLPPEEGLFLTAGLVTKEDVLEWSEATAPLFSVVLPTLLHLIMFPDVPYPPSRTSFELPRIEVESTFFDRRTSPLLFSFGCLSSSLRGTFVRLYTSLSDGLSFNRLLNALLGYGGPTLLLIRESKGGLFGAFTASSWKESKDFYGNSDCFLYQLLPTTSIYRPSGNATNYMYCNSEARSRGYDGLPHGIGFGGTAEQPRLFLNEEFDACVASSQDLTFESGPLLPRTVDGGLRKQFEIESLEVWGVGGEAVVNEALGARTRVRQIRDAAIRQSRKVDRASFLDDFRSGIIESKAFKYRQEIDGRADVDVDERNRKNKT